MNRYAGLSDPHGPLVPEAIRRLEAFFNRPSKDSWNTAYRIIIVGHPMTTLWQAVCAVDPKFPKRRPTFDNWPAIPDLFTARRALEWAKQRAQHAKENP